MARTQIKFKFSILISQYQIQLVVVILNIVSRARLLLKKFSLFWQINQRLKLMSQVFKQELKLISFCRDHLPMIRHTYIIKRVQHDFICSNLNRLSLKFIRSVAVLFQSRFNTLWSPMKMSIKHFKQSQQMIPSFQTAYRSILRHFYLNFSRLICLKLHLTKLT